MIFKRRETKLFLFTLLLFLAAGAGVLLWEKHGYIYETFIAATLIFLFRYFLKLHRKTTNEIIEFVEAIKYRDFSRNYNENNASPEIDLLHHGFNEVNKTFRSISKDKETQYQYLRNVLELIDTGILSYEIETGEVGWMNESLRQMIKLPYLKTLNSLSKRYDILTERIKQLQPGQHEVCAVEINKITSKILLSATQFQTENKTYKLIAFQNTGQVLDESEANAWQKLLRVMTHEIMNSVAPISSLAQTLSLLIDDAQTNENDAEWNDMKTCTETIKKRSDGLLKFTETYKNLNKINAVHTDNILVSTLFEHIYNLLSPALSEKNISFDIILKDPKLHIVMDVNLMEQALINLVLNAMDAVKDRDLPYISLSAYIAENQKPVIKVTDNGHGIEKEIADKIFVPFFTTKKNGNGIGLNLCRQIMMLHKGNIEVQSEQGTGTNFILHFQG